MKFLEEELIISIKRDVEKKKKELKVEPNLLYIPQLKKYRDLSVFNYPMKIRKCGYTNKDSKGRFSTVSKYSNVKRGCGYNYVFECILTEVAKKVQSEISLIVGDRTIKEAVDKINDYLSSKELYSGFSVRHKYNTNIEYIINYLLDKSHKNHTDILGQLLAFSHINDEGIEHHFILNTLVGPDYEGLFSSSSVSKCSTRSIYRALAMVELLNISYDYIYSDENILDNLIEKLSLAIKLDDNAIDEIRNADKETYIAMATENSFKIPFLFRSIITLAMEMMLGEAYNFIELEEQLKNMRSEYAKTYTTKKNIPKKVQAFMEDNLFLEMFGYVEVDELCDLSKLNALSKEFISLSKQLPLPLAKNHALRFRRLGKIKAAGVYYPYAKTLAVDIENMNSFIHEMMHMIDYESHLISYSTQFRWIAAKYRQIVDNSITQLGAEHPAYKEWFKSNKKYGRSYYFSCVEIFARLGELYVSEVLGIKSSFNHRGELQGISKYVYPMDKQLLESITPFYKNIFNNIKCKGTVSVIDKVDLNKVEHKKLVIDFNISDIKEVPESIQLCLF